MTHKSTETQRKQRAGLRNVRLGRSWGLAPVSYWVPVALAERIDRMCRKATAEPERRENMSGGRDGHV